MNLHAASPILRALPERDILGISVASIGRDEALALLRRLVLERRFTKVSFLNAHNANIAFGDPEFARALADFLVLPDGIGVDVAARILYGDTFRLRPGLPAVDGFPAPRRAARRQAQQC
jgi:UDP-N-acetyl-D-mannosaminuronic acid transferase (WecB/TagA/CpsF family)